MPDPAPVTTTTSALLPIALAYPAAALRENPDRTDGHCADRPARPRAIGSPCLLKSGRTLQSDSENRSPRRLPRRRLRGPASLAPLPGRQHKRGVAVVRARLLGDV